MNLETPHDYLRELQDVRKDVEDLSQNLQLGVPAILPDAVDSTGSPRHAFTEQSIMSRVQESAPWRYRRRIAGFVAAVALVGSGAEIGYHLYEQHHKVHNTVQMLPEHDIPNILSPTTGDTVPSKSSSTPSRSPEKPAIIGLAPSAPIELIIPRLGIDTQILPVDSKDTGQKNLWGGEIYDPIEFPIDSGKQKARYWVRMGEPNTLKGVTIEQNPQAVERTVIYGHAADWGSPLLFQNLQELQLGDTFILVAGTHNFIYRVYSLSNPAKDGLADDAQVYNVPPNGRKEAALVACLPNSASHSVRIGVLVEVTPHTSKS